MTLKTAVLMFYILGAMVFLQLLTGGLRVFGFIDEITHITTGIITFILAVITLVAAGLTKPRYRPSMAISALMVVLIFIQALIGFSFDNSSGIIPNTNGLIFLHFANALIIYGVAISGVLMAMHWSKMTAAIPPKQP